LTQCAVLRSAPVRIPKLRVVNESVADASMLSRRSGARSPARPNPLER
jgi:hypothetical protein